MAIVDLPAWRSKLASPYQVAELSKVSITTVSQRLSSYWAIANNAGSAPTTAVVPDNTTTGALGQLNTAGVQRPGRTLTTPAGQGTVGLIIADRLVHQGGLDGTSTSAQTTNLPTAALTRSTNGIGVHIGLEIYSAVGATATSVTVSYTNSNGTPGQVSLAVAFGGTGFRETSRFIPISLASGDVGVKSVESVTLAASTTAVGNFGVVLYKPYLLLPNFIGSRDVDWDAMIQGGGNAPSIPNGACLWALVSSRSTTAPAVQASIFFVED